MNETEVQFRTATVGGFQKQDVMIYIETASREHREKLEELQRQLDEAGAARASLEEELAAARAQSGEQEQELQRLREACAAAQAEGLHRIEPMLTEEELSVYRRGRNTHNNIPKNASPAVYRASTGLESLFGYLYLKGEKARIDALFSVIWEGEQAEEEL